MSVTGAYELGRRENEDHFSLVRIYEVRSDPFSGPFEEFLLGEPVYLKSIREKSRLSEGDAQLWWIQELIELEGAAKVGVSSSRNKPASTFVPVTELEKLPDMVRLAAEYAY